MRPQVFIAHSTHDAEWLERLKTMLAPLVRVGLSCWDDTQIQPGQHRQQEIATALAGARVAVLLVSPAFLASEFACEQELATVLAAARQEHGLKVFWVAIRPCMWRQTALAEYQAVHDAAKPLSTLPEREADASLVAICQHIHAAVASTPALSGRAPASSPYRGLSAFQIDDAPLFFGREVLTEKLWLRFKALFAAPDATRLLAVLGPSGSGKSSVARAGLLAALTVNPVPGPQAVRRIAIKPGEHPLRTLALALQPSSTGRSSSPDLGAQRKLIEDLGQPNKRGEFDGLTLWAANLPDAATSPLVLLVDQFEEVYTACRDPSERDAFVSLLLHAAGDRARHVAVLMTLRSDFLGETHRQHPELNRLVAEQAVIVPAMSRDELRRAIVEPAIRAGMPIDEATVELLLMESRGSEGALPLLEFALTRIWEGLLTGRPAGATLRDIGGIGGALASTAKGIYSALSEPEQVITRRALVRLVQLGEGTRDTRRRAPLGQLCGRGDREGNVLAVLRQFAVDNARMVTLSGRSGETVAEVTHETLFDHWTELRSWIDEGRADRRFHDRVAESARLWNEDRSRSGRLWRPPDLDLLRAFRARNPEDLSTLDEEFFAAAEQAQQDERAEKQQRTRFLHMGLALVSLLLVIAIGIASYAMKQQRAATHERDHAEQRELDMVIEQGRQLLVAKYARPIEALLRLQTAKARGSRSPILPYLIAEAARPLDAVKLILSRHSSAVTSASYSPDGLRILTSSLDQVQIWDAQRGLLLNAPMCLRVSSTSASYSPDGRRILTASADGKARVWDAQSSELLTTLRGHLASITGASYSPDGSRIVTSSADSSARVWDARSGQPLITLQGHSSFVTSANYSPDARYIVTSSGDKTAQIWDAQNGQPLITLQGHSASVTSSVYSPDGHHILTSSRDATARVWNAQSGQILITLQGHTSFVHSASYSPDGRRIVTGSRDQTARVWDAQSGQLLATLQGHSAAVRSASYSPDGRWIVTSSADRTVHVWDTQSGQLLSILQGHASSITSASYSPDGRRVVTASLDQTARIWDAQNGQLLAILQGATATSVSYSPDGRHLVTSGGDLTPRVWNAQNGQLLTTLQGHSSGVSSASYSPDGRKVATSSLDQTVRVWDAGSGHLITSLLGHDSAVTSANFSPDGRNIVTSSWDQTARVWDVGSGQLLATLVGHLSFVNSASYSPDGRRIVTSSLDQTAKIWDAQSGQLLTTLVGHSSGVNSASYSPDGLYVVTGSGDQTARIWDGQTGQLLGTLAGHSSGVNSARYSPDGRYIVTGSGDQTARIWDVSPETRSAAELESLILCRTQARLQGEAIVLDSVDPQACKRLTSRVPRHVVWDRKEFPLWAGIYALQAGRRIAAHAALAEARQVIEHFQDSEDLARLTLTEAALSASPAAAAPDSVAEIVSRRPVDQQARIWLGLADFAHEALRRPRWALWAFSELHRVSARAQILQGEADVRANELEIQLAAGLSAAVLQQAQMVLNAQTAESSKAVVASLAWVAAMQQKAQKDQQLWSQRAFDLYAALKDDTMLGWTLDGIRFAFMSQPECKARNAALELFTLLEQKKSPTTTTKLAKLLGVRPLRALVQRR